MDEAMRKKDVAMSAGQLNPVGGCSLIGWWQTPPCLHLGEDRDLRRSLRLHLCAASSSRSQRCHRCHLQPSLLSQRSGSHRITPRHCWHLRLCPFAQSSGSHLLTRNHERSSWSGAGRREEVATRSLLLAAGIFLACRSRICSLSVHLRSFVCQFLIHRHLVISVLCVSVSASRPVHHG